MADGVLDGLFALKEVGVDHRYRPGTGGNGLEALRRIELAAGEYRLDAHPGVLHIDGDHVGIDGAGGQRVALGGKGHRVLLGGGLFHQLLDLGQAGEIVLIHLAVGYHHNLVLALPFHGQAQILADKAHRHEGAVVFCPHRHIHGHLFPIDQGGGGVQLQLHRGAVQGAAHTIGLLYPLHGAAEGLNHPADRQHGTAILGHQHHGTAGLVDLSHSITNHAPGAIVPHGDDQIRLCGGGGGDQAQHQHQRSQQGQYASFHRHTSSLLSPEGVFKFSIPILKGGFNALAA